MTDEERGPEDDVEMGFWDHLVELRTRILRALMGVVPFVALAYNYSEQLLEMLLQPLANAYKAHGIPPDIHFKNLLDPFMVYLKISVIAGLLLASPWVFWQMWAFLAPALYRRERLMAIPFVLASSIFFVGGALFGHFIVFPLGFETFLEYAGALPSGNINLRATIMLEEHVDLCLQMLVAFGVVFEVPVVLTGLSALGLVTAKGLWKFGRWWLVIAAILSGVLTPPDVGSQISMLIPLMALYLVSVGIAWIIDGHRARKKAREEAAS